MKSALLSLPLIAVMLASAATVAFAADGEYTITVKDGKYTPADTVIPAGQKVKLIVKNETPAVVEFESYDLDREQKIQPNEQIEVFVGPLEKGSYPFFDDKNEDNKGTLTVR